jgi:hypothetical protein
VLQRVAGGREFISVNQLDPLRDIKGFADSL